eukprot:5620901-Amphidinium_carterae.2
MHNCDGEDFVYSSDVSVEHSDRDSVSSCALLINGFAMGYVEVPLILIDHPSRLVGTIVEATKLNKALVSSPCWSASQLHMRHAASHEELSVSMRVQ